MSGLPKKLQQAIELRARAYFKLRETYLAGGGALVFLHARRLADLDRLIHRREWLGRVESRDPEFDPIAMGC